MVFPYLKGLINKVKHFYIQILSFLGSAGSRVHLSFGWLYAHPWYQWTTLLSRSYYLCSSHVSSMKHVKGGGM